MQQFLSLMKNKIKIGILGTAAITRRSILPTLLDLSDNYDIVGVASRTLDQAKKMGEEFNVNFYVGYQSLLDIQKIDAVYIPLPNSLHAEWIEKSILRGLHILVEKSLACTYEEVVYLNQLAANHKVIIVENFQFRFHSQLQFIKDLVNNGTIGDLRYMRSTFGFSGLANNNIRYKKELGGGALLDTGAYPLKITQLFLGNDVEVKASNLNFSDEFDVDIWGGAYLKQKKGAIFSEVAFGFNYFYQCNLELLGSLGRIYTDRIFTAPKGYSPTVIIETQKSSEKIELKPDNHFENMLLYFYKLIKNKNQELIELEYIQNINQARLINEIKKYSI